MLETAPVVYTPLSSTDIRAIRSHDTAALVENRAVETYLAAHIAAQHFPVIEALDEVGMLPQDESLTYEEGPDFRSVAGVIDICGSDNISVQLIQYDEELREEIKDTFGVDTLFHLIVHMHVDPQTAASLLKLANANQGTHSALDTIESTMRNVETSYFLDQSGGIKVNTLPYELRNDRRPNVTSEQFGMNSPDVVYVVGLLESPKDFLVPQVALQGIRNKMFETISNCTDIHE